MRIACIGAGPAGLFLAILMKQQDPAHEITVYERNSEGMTYGWGVVFWEDLLSSLKESDLQTAREIEAKAFRWVDQVFARNGTPPVTYPGRGFSMRRQQLLGILAKRARALGIDIRYGHDIDSAALPNAELIVASDGVSSSIRGHNVGQCGTKIDVGRNKYVWLGTKKVFYSFTIGFVQSHAGWIWFHAYGFDPETSTFIVECSPETWTGLGFDRFGQKESLDLLEGIFEEYLDGHPLISRSRDEAGLPWLNSRRVINGRWHTGNVVLVGDAAHTTHFTIGLGTKLAIEDSIALASHLQEHDSLEAALQAYGDQRQAAIARSQRNARLSARWFENVPRYAGLPDAQFFALLLDRRSRLMPHIPPLLNYWLKRAIRRFRQRPPPRASKFYDLRKI
jgi:anthraniloyl-CoA monooxygenase